MKRKILYSLLFLACISSAITLAQYSGGNFDIAKSTIDNGGGRSAGGEFYLTGTIGQPDATLQISGGSGFLLAGGFWAKAHDVIFGDSFENN